VADVLRFAEIIGSTFGPQVLNLVTKQEEIARYLVEKMGLPEKLIRNKEEQAQVIQQLQSQMQQGTNTDVMGNTGQPQG